MSITSLTETAVRTSVRRRDAANGQGLGIGGGAAPALPADSALTKYIPTESITLYVAAISAAPALKSFSPWLNEMRIYWFFAVLTPVLFVLVFLGKRKTKPPPAPQPLKDWPWWKLFAATVAFLVWALAVPGNPYVKGDTVGGAVAGFFAIFISTILSIMDPLFDNAEVST